MSWEKLPVIIGKNLRKGILAFRNGKMKGSDVCIVWLKRNYPIGEEFDVKDIDKIDTVLHFCDRESLQNTIKILNLVLNDMIKE